MTRQEFEGLAELYALDLLDADEKAACEDYLRAEPGEAGTVLKKAVVLNTRILASVAEIPPPARLKARVVSALSGKPRRDSWFWAWAALAAGLVIAVVWVGWRESAVRAELASVRRLLDQQSADARRTAEVLSIVSAPGTRAISPQQGQGNYFVNPDRGVVLIASGVQAPAAGRTYQMWIIPKGRAPVPAGVFTPDAQGRVIHTFPTQVDVSATGAFAITDEPHGGSPAPTTTPQLVAPVPGA